jgi:Ca2+-binding RTX toxin-like protein
MGGSRSRAARALSAIALSAGVLVVTVSPAAAGPGTAGTFGSDLSVPPSPTSHPAYNGDHADCNDFSGHPCTLAAGRVHTGNAHAVGAHIPGVVVGFAIRSLTTDAITFRLVRYLGAGNYLGAGTGPSVTLGGTGAVESYPVSPGVPVAKGDLVGFDDPVTPIAQSANCDLMASWVEFSPPLDDGGTGVVDANSSCELLVNASVEPDLDQDLLGDDTQDDSVVVPACGYTQVGTAHDDVIDGFDEGDWIRGLRGRDKLRGYAGKDCLRGGAGRDTLNGGSGVDRLDCGGGDDVAIADRRDTVRDCERVRRS